MQINRHNNRHCYIIHTSNDKFLLCKVLNEYNSMDAANQELIALLTKKRTEKEILKAYNRKGE